METIKKLKKRMTLTHEADINTSPKKIWEFLTNIETNYK